MSKTVRAASAAWMIRPCRDEQAFWDHVLEVAREARGQGAGLLVLPEFITLELEGAFSEASLRPQERSLLLASSWSAVQKEVDSLGLLLVAGSAFERLEKGWVNRSPLVRPFAPPQWQDKQILTQWESAEWGLQPGEPLRRLEPEWLAVLVCYDCEFPPLALRQAEGGALVLAVPSWTETWHGFHRVRQCCRARAIENQLYVLHSSLLGSLGREPVPSAVGTAAILAPSVPPFPPDGVLAETKPDEEGLAIADLDLSLLLASREEGDVRNWHDRVRAWPQLPPLD